MRMLISFLVVLFLFSISGFCNVPPSPDFDLKDSVGFWNIVALFSTEQDFQLNFYSNATLNITLGAFDVVTVSLSYITFVSIQNNYTLIPSPFKKATLISPTYPSAEHEFVVTYYNSNSGEAVVVNSALTLGLAISRNNSPYYNNFSSTITEIFNNLSLPSSNLTFIFNNDWDIQNLIPAHDDSLWLYGNYIGNAIFTTDPSLQDLEECFELFILNAWESNNITVNFTHSTNQNSNLTYFTFIPSPMIPTIWASTQFQNVPPLVIIYANGTNPTSQYYVAATADRKLGFVFSTESPSQADLTAAKQALMQNGLIINSNNFYEMSTICELDLSDAEGIIS